MFIHHLRVLIENHNTTQQIKFNYLHKRRTDIINENIRLYQSVIKSFWYVKHRMKRKAIHIIKYMNLNLNEFEAT